MSTEELTEEMLGRKEEQNVSAEDYKLEKTRMDASVRLQLSPSVRPLVVCLPDRYLEVSVLAVRVWSTVCLVLGGGSGDGGACVQGRGGEEGEVGGGEVGAGGN